MIDQYKTLSEKFLKKGFWLYFFAFLSAPIGYIVRIIITGEVSEAEFGILYTTLALMTLLSAFNDLGMTESLHHFIPKYLQQNRYDKIKTIIFYALGVQIITSLLVVTGFYFFADWIAIHHFKTPAAVETLHIFGIFFIGLNVFQTLNTFFLAVQNTFLNRIIEWIRMMFVLGCVLFVYFGGTGSLVSYSYAWIIGLYIGIFLSLLAFYFRYYCRYFREQKIILDVSIFKEVSKYGLLVFIGASAATLLSQVDRQMIMFILGPIDAAYYDNYLSIIGIPFLLIAPIFGFLFPVFSELYSKGEVQRIKVVKAIFIKVFLLVGLMFNIYLFIFGQQIALTLFDERYLTSGVILQYSVLFLVFNYLLQINFNIMAGIGQVWDRAKIMIIALVFNCIGNWILIHWIGVVGAALATAFGWILIFVLSEIFLGKNHRIIFDWKSIGKNIFILGVLGLGFHRFLLPLFAGVSRGNSFLLLLLFSFVWFLIFVGVNFGMFKGFVGEVKKLKK